MICLFQRGSFYNPLFVDTDKGLFELKKILFFNKAGVIIQTSGWFTDKRGRHIGEYKLEGDELPIKRKPDYSLDVPFLVHIGKTRFNRSSDRNFPELKTKHGELYIPYWNDKWTLSSEIRYGPLQNSYYEIYAHRDGFCIRKFIKDVKIKKNIEFHDKVLKAVSVLGLSDEPNVYRFFTKTTDGKYIIDKTMVSKLKEIVNSL